MNMQPINFMKWINENRDKLKPPVGNQQIWPNREFMVTVVGGPNQRRDFHINHGEEFFYQIEGTLNLRMRIDNKTQDFLVGPGEIFLLPPGVPHSPQRPASSVGLVLERQRAHDELDAFVWFCKSCDKELYREALYVQDLVTDLPPVFERFKNRVKTCPHCGSLEHTAP